MQRHLAWTEWRRVRRLPFLALVGVLLVAALGVASVPRGARAAAFSVGDTVLVNTDGLNLRTAAGTDASVVAVLSNGTVATIADGPQSANGYDWYQVDVSDGSTGWVAGDFLVLAGSIDPGFSVGDGVAVVDGTLNLRDAAGLGGNIVSAMPEGTTATVLSGPVTADGLPWYQLDAGSFGQGWSVAGFLALASDGPSNTFPVDAILLVDTGDGSNLNLRESAGLNAAVLGKLPFGSRVVVTDGPVSQDGYDWYQLTTDLGTGWAAGAFLAYPADAIAVGDTVSVTDGTLNLRDAAGLGGNVLDKLPDGTVLEVTDGPTAADGYTWFQVTSSDFGTGWVAGEFLRITPTSGGTATATATATTTATATSTATSTTTTVTTSAETSATPTAT